MTTKNDIFFTAKIYFEALADAANTVTQNLSTAKVSLATLMAVIGVFIPSISSAFSYGYEYYYFHNSFHTAYMATVSTWPYGDVNGDPIHTTSLPSKNCVAARESMIEQWEETRLYWDWRSSWFDPNKPNLVDVAISDVESFTDEEAEAYFERYGGDGGFNRQLPFDVTFSGITRSSNYNNYGTFSSEARCYITYVCTATGKEPPAGESVYSYCGGLCPEGKRVVGTVDKLMDGCSNGCTVGSLSPTHSDTRVNSLQGITTGGFCTDGNRSGEEVDLEKMMACGTTGGSDFEVKPVSEHPINFATGNKYFHDTDHRSSGHFPIVFGRSYNSLDLGWRYAYTQRIDRVESDVVAVRRPNGQRFKFRLIDGVWTPDPDVTDRLEAVTAPDGSHSGWNYHLSGNREETFDAGGRLLSLRNAAGLKQTLSYSAEGKQFVVTDPQGGTLLVILGENGRNAESIEDSQGRVTSYQYDGPNLTRVTYPDGSSKQYLYEDSRRNWLITGIIDENGHRSHTVAYDSRGRAIRSELANGADRITVAYLSDGRVKLTNALGKQTLFHFKTLNGVRKIVHVDGEPTATCQGTAMDYQFNDDGFLIEKSDAKGNITQYERDSNGLVRSLVEAKGQEAERTIVTEWNTELRKPLLITRATNQTRFTYDEAGRPRTRTLIDIKTGAERTTTYHYNDEGLPASVDGPRTDVSDITNYHYDEQGLLARVTNALGHTTSILSRDTYGRATSTVDANGLTTTLTYDTKGRLESRRVGSQTTTLGYDAVGNLTKVTHPDGTYLLYRYDDANRLTGVEDQQGNTMTYILDALGNKTSEKVFDRAGELLRTHKRTYDELGRLLTSVGAQEQTIRYGYDRNDNHTRTIDPLRQVTENAYDGLNRLIQQTDSLGNTTGYTYDDEDRLTRVTDPNGNATTYEYDGLGNRTARHSPNTGTTGYTHDAAGNLITKRDAKGQTTTYRYDALNRLTQTDFADGTNHTYTYDACPNGIGRLCTITDSSGSTEWAYNRYGKVARRTQTLLLDGGTTTLTTAYQYDAAGHLSGMTYPSGMQADYAYADGHISAIDINGEPLLSNITYQPFGPVTGWTWSSGSNSVRGYDLDGRLISQTLGNTARTLRYDDNGNIEGITEPDNTQVFGYDALNRLTAGNDNVFNLAWEYDANGNRLSETDAGTTTPYTTEMTSNRLMAVGDTPYRYDNNGNLIQDGEHTYQFNTRNRLAGVDEGAIGEYRYNAIGQRVYKKGSATPCDVDGDGRITHADLERATGQEKQSIEADGPGNGEAKGRGQAVACIATQMNHGNGNTKELQSSGRQLLFTYDAYRLLGEYDLSGNAVQETVWFGNLPVATIQNGTTYYIHSDHLGTPRVILDTTGKEIWRWDSDPFGVTGADGDPDGDGEVFTYNLRFPGQYFDEETGLNYNYFRDYDPSTGRYIESDLIGLRGGLNTFAYVDGNPLQYRDLFGLKIYVDPQYQSTVDSMMNQSPIFNQMYKELDAKKYDIYITPMSWKSPTTWFISEPAGGKMVIPGRYTIAISDNACEYKYPGTDGEKHNISLERILAHELSHPYLGAAGEERPIKNANDIMKQINPSDIPRDPTTPYIYRP